MESFNSIECLKCQKSFEYNIRKVLETLKPNVPSLKGKSVFSFPSDNLEAAYGEFQKFRDNLCSTSEANSVEAIRCPHCGMLNGVKKE